MSASLSAALVALLDGVPNSTAGADPRRAVHGAPLGTIASDVLLGTRLNELVSGVTDLASTANGKGASLIGVEDAAGDFAGATVEAVLAEIIADYALTTSGNGASKIGIEDSAGDITATTVEGALAENRAALDVAELAVLEASKQVWHLPMFGTWALDGDGANTNGAGIVGDVTGTEAAAALAKIEDATVFANLADSAGEAGYTGAYQLFPDTPVAEADYVYFGHTVPFCEIGLDLTTPAVFDSTAVMEWFYWSGAAWSALTIAHDGSEATAKDGTEWGERDGAISFVPPSDWASTSVDSQAGFWIRSGIASGKAANMTTVGLMDATEHDTVAPANGFAAPCDGTITDLRIVDGATTLHTTADVKFILMNFTSGDHSGELTFAQDIRATNYDITDMSVTEGDLLGVLVTQEDGTAEVINAALQVSVTVLPE